MNNRAPSLDMSGQLLRETTDRSAWNWFAAGTFSTALSALWEEAMQMADNGEWVHVDWTERLPLAPPPPNLRERALAWLAKRAQHADEHVCAPAMRGIAIAAALSAWNLAAGERAMLRDVVEQAAKERSQNAWMAVVALEAPDAVSGRYALISEGDWEIP